MKVFINKENKKLSGIYCILNTINGKFYIGSTVGFWQRYKDHINTLKRNDHHSDHFQNSFNIYGQDAFQFHILETLERDKIAIRKVEQKYLDFLQPFDEIGYNISRKAEGVDVPINKDRYRQLLGRKIIAYHLDGTFFKQFISISEAEEELGIGHASIIYNCQCKTNRALKWMFKYFDGQIYPDQIEPYKNSLAGKKRPKETIDRIVATRKKNGKTEKMQRHLDSLSEKRKGLKHSQETKNKQSASHKGKIRTEQHKINNDAAVKLAHCKPILVSDWLGYPLITFPSLQECADHYKVSPSTLCECIKKDRLFRNKSLVYLTKEEYKIAA